MQHRPAVLRSATQPFATQLVAACATAALAFALATPLPASAGTPQSSAVTLAQAATDRAGSSNGAAAAASPPATCPPTPTMPSPEQIEQARRDAKDRGLLWRITKDGRTSYLYGSMHVGKPGWIVPGPKLREALIASDTIALELDLTDPMVQRQAARASQRPSTPLPDDVRARLATHRDAACLQDSVFDRLHPIMQVVTLNIVAARWEGLDGSFGTEVTLAGFGRASAKRVVSLESVDRQMNALIPALDADELNAGVRSALDQMDNNLPRAVIRRMSTAWEQGRLEDFENYAAWCDCLRTDADRRALTRLNDDRNPHLAGAIAALHAQGSKLFAAVGALHMTGPKALPGLLSERGFTVERVRWAP